MSARRTRPATPYVLGAMKPKPLRVLALLVLAVAAFAPGDAGAKGVAVLAVVGSDGRSITIDPEPAVLGVMLYHPASVYNVRPRPAKPRGGYVKLYPLGRAASRRYLAAFTRRRVHSASAGTRLSYHARVVGSARRVVCSMCRGASNPSMGAQQCSPCARAAR